MKLIKRGSHLWAAVLIFSLLAPVVVFAQREYRYDSIKHDITVSEDTTFTVRETLTYRFVGEYHLGWRAIPYKGIDEITDIRVYDGDGRMLSFSNRFLERTDPASWGKYSFKRKGRQMVIEWYYDARDEVRQWTLEYRIHGGLSFLKDMDEIYWNLFTDYDVPIGEVEARVYLPSNNFNTGQLQAHAYSSAGPASAEVLDDGSFYFSAHSIPAYADFTIAAGWPRGLIDRSVYWQSFFRIYALWILAWLSVIFTVLYIPFHWYFTERFRKGRKTIVPQYDPPKQLPPAMADILVHERISRKAWAATVIDLAVRGYVKIEADPETALENLLRKFIWLFPLLPIAMFVIIASLISWEIWFKGPGAILILLFIVIAAIPIVRIIKKTKTGEAALISRDYTISRVNESDAKLQDYERSFLNLLGDKFSTRAMRKSPSKSRAMYKEMKKLEHELLKETESDTGAYEKPVSRERIRNIILGVGGFLFLIVLQFSLTGYIFSPIIIIILCLTVIVLFVAFEARLTHEGAVLREEWLGFKLYLETAERYRMQNLTPETFEKFLPYAIIFGVEQKWGRAFDSLHMAAPSWYGTAHVHGAYAASPAPSFSASVFSSSFSSSFTSAFSSSGGGGASGGGGGAGGGGGGGGGGAG